MAGECSAEQAMVQMIAVRTIQAALCEGCRRELLTKNEKLESSATPSVPETGKSTCKEEPSRGT